MQITTEYLDAFAIETTEPIEIPLNGWEMFAGAGTINIDDPEEHGLMVLHWDDWPSWRDAIASPGVEKRWTLVTVTKAGQATGEIGYEFPGLIKLGDLRAWYRDKLGIIEAPADEVSE